MAVAVIPSFLDRNLQMVYRPKMALFQKLLLRLARTLSTEGLPKKRLSEITQFLVWCSLVNPEAFF